VIVFDIRCEASHGFEGWFADAAAFATQRDEAMIACPFCGSTSVERVLSVPRIAGTGDRPNLAEVTKKLAALQQDMLKDSTWVGDNFAERARAMADGTEPQKTIHGQATLGTAKELSNEGISVMPLPFPVVPPESRN
jgi:hypothetical protein